MCPAASSSQIAGRNGLLSHGRSRRLSGLADAGRHGLDPDLMPYSDADASPFDLEFGQMVAFQQVDQLLNLLRLGCGILGAFGAERPWQHDGGSRYARFAGLLPAHRTRST